ncbi:MAG: type II toxin-antitoxin system Phd/YefM family antitoxin [Gammaproteobacteria bacterium]|nr:type II toxin-antitoxin system Phd/YefM family antitoxin [Gammaproteobacteria bacterium]
MSQFASMSTPEIWTISEAKARLSELLQLANETPQYIGTKKTYVLISQEKWQMLNQSEQALGEWLVDNLSELGDLKLPDRTDPAREIPFQ